MGLSANQPLAMPTSCATCTARCTGLCSLLGPATAARLSERTQQASYARGADIASQGERSDRIGILSAGLVKVVLLTEEGEDHLLQVLKPGEIVGDPCKAENAFSWEAATDSSICWLPRQALDRLSREDPQLYQACLGVISRQLEVHRLWAASMRGRNTLQRIAFWLVQQLPDRRDTARAKIRIVLTRRDLASLLDMTVETLCRGLHQLADRGAIVMLAPDELEVADMVKLRLFARCADKAVSALVQAGPSRGRGDNPFRISENPARLSARSAVVPFRQDERRPMTVVNVGRIIP